MEMSVVVAESSFLNFSAPNTSLIGFIAAWRSDRRGMGGIFGGIGNPSTLADQFLNKPFGGRLCIPRRWSLLPNLEASTALHFVPPIIAGVL